MKRIKMMRKTIVLIQINKNRINYTVEQLKKLKKWIKKYNRS